MRQPGRCHQRQATALARQAGQRRQQQADFADTATVDQDFGEISARPAAARQFSVEFGVTAGDGAGRQAGQGIAAPDVAAGKDIGKIDSDDGR